MVGIYVTLGTRVKNTTNRGEYQLIRALYIHFILSEITSDDKSDRSQQAEERVK